ncbi:MAG: hypothetical protein ACFFDN_00515 [Candidatus Hodarchaeota archaeon]
MSLSETIICKNCGHQLYRLDNGTFEHFTRFYHEHSMPYHSKECYAEKHYQDIFGQPVYCGCRKPEPEQKILDLTLNYKKELEKLLKDSISKSERIFIERVLGDIKDNLELLEG